MLNNYINIHDFNKIYKKIRRESIIKNFTHLSKKDDDRVIGTWNERSYQEPTNWWNIPEVIERWNMLITGQKDMNYRDYVYTRYLSEKKNLHALVLGCGAGKKTILWAKLGIFENIDAYDMSDVRIVTAKEQAEKNKVGNIINFCCKDIREIKNGSYDIIIVENALHHFSPLSDVLDNVDSVLKTDGIFIMDEFVGPTRFQWTQRQLEAINGCLMLLPDKYKRFYNSHLIKEKMYSTGRFFMKLSDPSEAVESSDILQRIHERFEIREEKPYGGGVMHMLFNAIAHNFINNDIETQEWLKIIFSVEDVLMKNGDVGSDFVFGVYGKKSIKRN